MDSRRRDTRTSGRLRKQVESEEIEEEKPASNLRIQKVRSTILKIRNLNVLG